MTTPMPDLGASTSAMAAKQLAAIDELAARAESHLDQTSDDELWRFALNARISAANLALAIDHHEPIPARAHTETMRTLQAAQEAERLDKARIERRTAEMVDAEVARTVRMRSSQLFHRVDQYGGPTP